MYQYNHWYLSLIPHILSHWGMSSNPSHEAVDGKVSSSPHVMSYNIAPPTNASMGSVQVAVALLPNIDDVILMVTPGGGSIVLQSKTVNC